MNLRNTLLIIWIALLSIACSIIIYVTVKNQHVLQEFAGRQEPVALDKHEEKHAVQAPSIGMAKPTWRDLQSLSKDTVVQVFANKAVIDLLQPQRPPSQSQAAGSGFFINAEGELVTNAHVADQAQSMWIQIPSLGKDQIDVELVGISHDRDIALLRVTPEGVEKIRKTLGEISYLRLGDSDLVHRADEIMALGYPLGQQNLKSTTGVVSGHEQHLLQIDAPINPGSSGGPSLNDKGEVIGINTSGVSEAQNVGYIIPVNELKLVLDDLRAADQGSKLLRRPFLGMFFHAGSEALTDYLGNPQPGGVFVADVYKNSLLHKAGAQKHDMIYEINGHRLDIYGELLLHDEKISWMDYTSRLKLGEEIKLVTYRNGTRKELVFNFYQTDLLPIHKIFPGYEPLDFEIVAGMIIQPLTINHVVQLVNNVPGLIRFADLRNQTEPALVITHVFIDSLAQRSRILIPGCLLSKINGVEVKTLDELRTALFKSLETKRLMVETEESLFAVFDFDKVLSDEKRLSRDFMYDTTPAVQALLNKVEHLKKPDHRGVVIPEA